MSSLDHAFLYTLLFVVFFVFTQFRQSFLNRHYWQIVAIPIILYSLILGCRYGWGNDYLWYKLRFERPFFYKEEDFGFRTLNLSLSELGLNYIGAYITYSLIYIATAFVLIKDYKENKYMLTLFLPATVMQSTFTIRQSVAHSFVFLAFYFLSRKKWSYIAFMLLITYSIHPAALLLTVPIALFFLLKAKAIPWQVSIPVYIIASLLTEFLSSQITSIATQYLPMLSLSNKFDNYVQNEYWFNENAIQEEWKQGTLTLILSMAFHISIFYIGYIALKYRPKQKVIYFYNTIVIGFIMQRLFWTFEIFRRIATPFTILYFIPLGYAFFFLRHNIKRLPLLERNLCIIAITFILMYLVLFFGRFILQSPTYDFFWNK